MSIPKITGFQAVVLSGSCGCNAIDLGDGIFGRGHELARSCGHVHRTEKAAEKCLAKQLNYQKDGTCSAAWYNGKTVPLYQGYEGMHLVITL